MRRLRIWRHRLRSIFSKEQADASLARELAFHFDQLVQENIAAGLSLQQAREAARRTFGNVPLLEEECRDYRRMGWLHDLWQDIGYGGRVLRSNLRFTIIAVLSLALGIGANTAILGTLRTALRGEIPIPEGDRIMLLRGYTAQRPYQLSNATVPEYLRWKERLHSFAGVDLSIANRQDLTDSGDGVLSERLTGQAVTPTIFSMVGVAPMLGRTFSDDEGRVESPARVIVLSHRLWQRAFGSDRAIVNRSIVMDGRPWTVIGVMPPGFWYPSEDCEYWIPIGITQEQRGGSARLFAVTARLKEGVSRQQAQAELDTVSGELAREFPDRQRDWRARAVPLREFWFGWLMLPLSILEAAGAMVLLIACTNVGALLLARATARREEFAMRIALGASHERLMRQLIAEGLLLSAFAGICSLAVGWACVRLLAMMQPPPSGAHTASLELGAPAIAIAVLLSILSGLAAGAAPMLWGVKRGASLRESAERAGRSRWRSVLVAVQLSLALVLLIVSGLLTKALYRAAFTDRGFDVDGLLSFEFHIPPRQYLRSAGSYQGLPVGEARTTTVTLRRVYERLKIIPGVEAVAGISASPVNALVVPELAVLVDGTPSPGTRAERDALVAVHLIMTPGYLRTVRATVVRGRDVSEADAVSSPWVAVINETMAKRFWPGEDPIGKRFKFDVAAGEQIRTVVGVVHDMVQVLGGFAPRPVAYTSYEQQPEYYRGPAANQYGQMTFVLRGRGDPSELVPAVRYAVAEVEPTPISNVSPLVWWGGAGTINRGLYAGVVLGFATVATLLACMGVYGVTAYSVSRRTREIGIRVALGAQWPQIRRLLWSEAGWSIVISVIAGVVTALALTRFLSSELGQVSPYDPWIFAGAILLLSSVALTSSVAPARAGRKISPAIVLRSE